MPGPLRAQSLARLHRVPGAPVHLSPPTEIGMEAKYQERLSSIERIQEGFAELNYICSRPIATAIYVSCHLGKPLLVEGPAGVGKTELANATSEYLGVPMIRMQCYEGLDESKALRKEGFTFVGPTTMEGWRGVDVHERLQEAVRWPAFVEVDSAAAAHCERLYGVGEELFNFYYLYLGVGLGGCVIYDGQVVRGAWGNAGEIGHIPLVPDGDPCPCGNRGCLERYLSLEAYARRTPIVGEAGWLEETAPVLRSAIVTIENLFDPETIVLGGFAPPELRLKLLALTAELPNSLASRQDRVHPRVMLARCGADAVLRGAASLAITEVLSPRSAVRSQGATGGAAAGPFAKAGSARIA